MLFYLVRLGGDYYSGGFLDIQRIVADRVLS